MGNYPADGVISLEDYNSFVPGQNITVIRNGRYDSCVFGSVLHGVESGKYGFDRLMVIRRIHNNRPAGIKRADFKLGRVGDIYIFTDQIYFTGDADVAFNQLVHLVPVHFLGNHNRAFLPVIAGYDFIDKRIRTRGKAENDKMTVFYNRGVAFPEGIYFFFYKIAYDTDEYACEQNSEQRGDSAQDNITDASVPRRREPGVKGCRGDVPYRPEKAFLIPALPRCLFPSVCRTSI